MALSLQRCPQLRFKATDSNNNPLSNGYILTYLAGSSDSENTYKDWNGSVWGSGRVDLDPSGEAEILLDSTKAYKFKIYDASGDLYHTEDNITVGSGSGVGIETYRVKTDIDDVSPGFLDSKLQAGDGISMNLVIDTINGNSLTISHNGKIKVRSDSTSNHYIEDIIEVGDGLTKVVTDDTITISAIPTQESGKVKVDANDPADYLENQIQAGNNIGISKVDGKLVIDSDIVENTFNDSSSINFNQTLGNVTADVVVSTDANNKLESRSSGLYVEAEEVLVEDTYSVHMENNDGTLSADIKLSPAAGNLSRIDESVNSEGLYTGKASSEEFECVNLQTTSEFSEWGLFTWNANEVKGTFAVYVSALNWGVASFQVTRWSNSNIQVIQTGGFGHELYREYNQGFEVFGQYHTGGVEETYSLILRVYGTARTQTYMTCIVADVANSSNIWQLARAYAPIGTLYQTLNYEYPTITAHTPQEGGDYRTQELSTKLVSRWGYDAFTNQSGNFVSKPWASNWNMFTDYSGQSSSPLQLVFPVIGQGVSQMQGAWQRIDMIPTNSAAHSYVQFGLTSSPISVYSQNTYPFTTYNTMGGAGFSYKIVNEYTSTSTYEEDTFEFLMETAGGIGTMPYVYDNKHGREDFYTRQTMLSHKSLNIGVTSLSTPTYIGNVITIPELKAYVYNTLSIQAAPFQKTTYERTLTNATIDVSGYLSPSVPFCTVYINANDGTLGVKSGGLTYLDRSNGLLSLFVAQTSNGSTITGITRNTNFVRNAQHMLRDMFDITGNPKSGMSLSGRSGDLGFDVSSGTQYIPGSAYDANTNWDEQTDTLSISSINKPNLYWATQNGVDLTSRSVIDAVNYNPSGSTISALGVGNWTNHRVFTVQDSDTSFNTNKQIYIVQYGQVQYNSKADALAGIPQESFVTNETTSKMTQLGIITIRKNSTNTTSNCVFTQTDKWGGIGGGGGSGSSFIQSVADTNSIDLDVDVSGALTANAKLSSNQANALSIQSDGLYSPNFDIFGSCQIGTSTGDINVGANATVTTSTNMSFEVGQLVYAFDKTNPSLNYIWGSVVSYNKADGTLVFNKLGGMFTTYNTVIDLYITVSPDMTNNFNFAEVTSSSVPIYTIARITLGSDFVRNDRVARIVCNGYNKARLLDFDLYFGTTESEIFAKVNYKGSSYDTTPLHFYKDGNNTIWIGAELVNSQGYHLYSTIFGKFDNGIALNPGTPASPTWTAMPIEYQSDFRTVSDSTTVDLTLSSGDLSASVIDGSISTAKIGNNQVTLAKMATQAGNTILANATASSAVPSDVSVGTNTVVGRVGGDLVAAQLVDAQIASSTITNAKLATMATKTIKGNINTVAGIGDVAIKGTSSLSSEIISTDSGNALVVGTTDKGLYVPTPTATTRIAIVNNVTEFDSAMASSTIVEIFINNNSSSPIQLAGKTHAISTNKDIYAYGGSPLVVQNGTWTIDTADTQHEVRIFGKVFINGMSANAQITTQNSLYIQTVETGTSSTYSTGINGTGSIKQYEKLTNNGGTNSWGAINTSTQAYWNNTFTSPIQSGFYASLTGEFLSQTIEFGFSTPQRLMLYRKKFSVPYTINKVRMASSTSGGSVTVVLYTISGGNLTKVATATVNFTSAGFREATLDTPLNVTSGQEIQVGLFVTNAQAGSNTYIAGNAAAAPQLSTNFASADRPIAYYEVGSDTPPSSLTMASTTVPATANIPFLELIQ